jgi:hypothetical protein
LSPQLWLTKNRNWLALAGGGLAGLVIGALIRSPNPKSQQEAAK